MDIAKTTHASDKLNDESEERLFRINMSGLEPRGAGKPTAVTHMWTPMVCRGCRGSRVGGRAGGWGQAAAGQASHRDRREAFFSNAMMHRARVVVQQAQRERLPPVPGRRAGPGRAAVPGRGVLQHSSASESGASC